MSQKILRQLHRIRQLFQHLAFRDAFLFALLTVLRVRKELQIRIGTVDLAIRTCTPDLRVAFSSLVNGEYSSIQSDNPRFIIDAGGNIGTSAIAFAMRFPTATIVAIEPEADNFRILCRNVAPWPNVKPLKAALTAESGSRQLLDRGTGAWGYTVTESQQTVGSLGQLVNCVSIPALMDQFQMDSIDILKLDIEGGEKEVLENSAEWINSTNVLVAELHERIVKGCNAAFQLATVQFPRQCVVGEKRIAYRQSAT